MKQMQIPTVLHEILGERKSVGSILAILLFGGVFTAAIYHMYPEMTGDLPLWRSALALLLVFDIGCGCIANFTAGTSNYYAKRPGNRLIFLSVHVHPLLVALLLGTSLGHAAAVWAYTIGAAFLVNVLIGRPSHRCAAGLLLAIGLGCIPLLSGIEPYMLAVYLLFMLKVLFGFAVDHYNFNAT